MVEREELSPFEIRRKQQEALKAPPKEKTLFQRFIGGFRFPFTFGQKTIGTMTYPELKEAKERHTLEKDTQAAIVFIERMLKLCDDINEIADLMIELANLYYDQGNLERAGQIYIEFEKLYPGNVHAEYALYRSILCTFYGILTIDRDQTKTYETVELANKFLSRTIFTQYQKEVRDIRKQCYQKLVESELNVCAFYLNRKSFKAVQNRLKNIRTALLSYVPEMEFHVLLCECELADSMHDSKLKELKQKELEKLPSYEQMVAAQQKAKRSLAFRF
jgi:outer membrane assembly lipoprotein YfiO